MEYWDLTRDGDGETATYGVSCPHCGEYYRVRLTVADVEAWQGETLIQDAFPYLAAEEREMIKTGFHPACWRDMFYDEEDEDGWY